MSQTRVWHAQAPEQNRPERYERALHDAAEGLVYQLPGYGEALWVGTAVLLLVLGAVVLFARAAFGGVPDERVRAAWPFRLTVFVFVLLAVPPLVWLQGNLVTDLSTWPMSLWSLLTSLAFLSAAPYEALLWHIWRQIAVGGRWDLKRAVDGAVRTWVPMLGLLIVSMLPSIVLLDLVALLMSLVPQTPRVASAAFAVHSVLTPLFTVVTPLFALALAFVPWLIVDERIGVREALCRSWALARDNAGDLLSFALRSLVLYGAVDFFRTWQDPGPAVDYSLATAAHSLSGFIERLIAILAIGVLYQHLRTARTGVSVPPIDVPEAP